VNVLYCTAIDFLAALQIREGPDPIFIGIGDNFSYCGREAFGYSMSIGIVVVCMYN